MTTMKIELRNCQESAAAGQRSILALVELLKQVGLSEALESLASLSHRYGLSLADQRDLFACELSLKGADGAADQDVFRVLPSQGYLELVAAVAQDFGVETVVSHGWPILSVESRIPTVAEGAAPASAAPEDSQ